jgi:YegS/Rv2252/BmrU family lipid kinase
MHALVLLNATAGTAQRDPEGFRKRVHDGFAARGVDADVRLIKGADVLALAEAFVSDSAGRPGSVLVVGGGDGTIGCAVSRVAGSDVTLGILPLGTFNHFARDLGIPLDVDDALATVAEGRIKAVDIASVNGRTFVNNSSIGFYPFLVAERTAEQKRRGVGKLAAILPALARTLRADTWQRVRIRAEGSQKDVRTPCVFVGNNLYDMAAMGRRSSIDQGELSVYIVKPQTWLGLFLLPFKIALGLTRSDRDVERLLVHRIEIESRHPIIRVSMDGETIRAAPPLRYEVRPAALKVLVPMEAAGDGERGGKSA